MHETQPQPSAWIRGAVWALGLGIGILTAGLGALYHSERSASLDRHGGISNRLETVEGIVSGLATSVARTLERIDRDSDESGYWKDRIDRNRDGIAELRTNSMARKDPFTGTEGREHERRIDAVEHSVSSLAALSKRLDLVEQTQREYQAAIIPLIHQSNSLQMQRMQKEN